VGSDQGFSASRVVTAVVYLAALASANSRAPKKRQREGQPRPWLEPVDRVERVFNPRDSRSDERPYGFGGRLPHGKTHHFGCPCRKLNLTGS